MSLFTVSLILIVHCPPYHLRNIKKASAALRRSFLVILITNEKFWTLLKFLKAGLVPKNMKGLFTYICNLTWYCYVSLVISDDVE